jgi:hypothetical protein
LKNKRENLRVIFIYGEIDDNFEETYNELVELQIYDIILTFEIDDVFPKIAAEPMTKATLDESIAEAKAEAEDESDLLKSQSREHYIYDVQNNIALRLDSVTVHSDNFDMLTVQKIVETEPDKVSLSCITIAFTALQHHIGCTHLSFELATYLWQQHKKVCVVICDRETYLNMIEYYKVPSYCEKEGFLLQGKINVFPFEKYEQVRQKFNYVIGDFGLIRVHQRHEFENSAIKIMLCSAADWDLSVATDFINNSNLPYIKEVNYFFYPINQAVFVGFNKQMLRWGLKAYRIQTSPGCFSPCVENRHVFAEILKKYTNITIAKEPKVKKQKTKKKSKNQLSPLTKAYIAGGILFALLCVGLVLYRQFAPKTVLPATVQTDVTTTENVTAVNEIATFSTTGVATREFPITFTTRETTATEPSATTAMSVTEYNASDPYRTQRTREMPTTVTTVETTAVSPAENTPYTAQVITSEPPPRTTNVNTAATTAVGRTAR